MNFIKQYRLQRNMTQAEFAAFLGVTRVTVSRWENGLFPTERNMFQLAHKIGIDFYELKENLKGEN